MKPIAVGILATMLAAPRYLKSVRGIGYRFDLEDITES